MKHSTYNTTSLGRIYLFIRSLFLEYKRTIYYALLTLFLLPFFSFVAEITIFKSYTEWVSQFNMQSYYLQTFVVLGLALVFLYYILVSKSLNNLRVPQALVLPVSSGEKLIAFFIIGLLTALMMVLLPYVVTILMWLINISSVSYSPISKVYSDFFSAGAWDAALVLLVLLSMAIIALYFFIRTKKVVTAVLMTLLVYIVIALTVFIITIDGVVTSGEPKEMSTEAIYTSVLVASSIIIVAMTYFSYRRLCRKEVRA